jgi:hypothetical protein
LARGWLSLRLSSCRRLHDNFPRCQSYRRMTDRKSKSQISATKAHDPRREVEKIREHLGSREGQLAFLMGAGTSAAVSSADGAPLIPTVTTLNGTCRDAVADLGDDQIAAYDLICAECQAELEALGEATEPPTFARPVNVEDVLSAVRTKLSAIGDRDVIAGLDRDQLQAVEESIRSTIATAAAPADEQIPDRLPHHQFARWVNRLACTSPIELFTTNYDTLFERALEDERLSVFDGFVGSHRPFFSAASLSRPNSMPGFAWTRLWKLHGSINWSTQSFADGSDRIVRGAESTAGELIFPSLHKYDESRKQPYASILNRLGRLLDSPDGVLLVVLGYSFGDQHINEVIFDALGDRDGAHVFALQHEELPDNHPLIARAMALPNLLVYGPETAVLGGDRRPWILNEAVEDRTAELLDIPFDSDAVPDPDVIERTGRFRLGDFNYFTKFLADLAGGDD